MSFRNNSNRYQRPWRGRGFSRGFRGSRRPYMHNSGNNRSYDRTSVKALTEKDISVTEYLSQHEGFNGIIKSRFSDFQVSEINQNGEIAKLTDLAPPKAPEDEEPMDDEDLLLNKYNLEILPMETWDRINKMTLCSGTSLEDIVEIDVTGKSKEERTTIHDAVKKAFGDSIVGKTVTRDEKKYCTFEKYRKGARIDNRIKWVWPEEYLHFILYKENCDTMEAASRIIKRLRMNASIKTAVIGYAGTKDRRAKTSQWFSLRKVDPRKLISACTSLPDISVGNFTFSATHLKLGMLKGNRFRICLRNVTASDKTIDNCCSLLRDNGFINYYGLQRFGSRISVPTSQIGLYLLKSNFEEAIKCILEPRPGPLYDALIEFRNRGPYAAKAMLPHRADHCSAEMRLLTALASQSRDLAQALDKVPRNTRLLYLHSYQSLIWNKVVSMRLRSLSHAPAVGDLVPVDDIEEETVELEENLIEDDSEVKPPEINTPKSIPQVKTLTQEDIDSGKYTIFDIVLPLPGHSVVYPPNMKEHYQELLTKDGLSLDLKHKNKSYSLCGGYRHIAVKPDKMSWRTVQYTEPHTDLILSDLDLINGVTSTGEVEGGKYKALLLDITLPTSCYATMALRELMRVDTSTETQAKQNDYYKEDGDVKNEANATDANVTDTSDANANISDANIVDNAAEKRKGEDTDSPDTKKAKVC
ncbi:unnamed protein product [Leptosia nina]|uniref:TRUD domain-containing protein n=1 Tax=Leptosia nina TaxID=320188 RepID=A0AAV1JSP5_9NEOP